MKTPQQQAEELARKCAKEWLVESTLYGRDALTEVILLTIPLPELLAVAMAVERYKDWNSAENYAAMIDALTDLKKKGVEL